MDVVAPSGSGQTVLKCVRTREGLPIRPRKKGIQGINARVPCRFDKVQASVHAIVDHLLPVDAVLLLEVGVESRLDVVQDRFPAVRSFVAAIGSRSVRLY